MPRELGIQREVFEKNTLHIHVPAGAIPKDGPSAGDHDGHGDGLAPSPASPSARTWR